MQQLRLFPQHVKFLVKRGISEREAIALGYRSVGTLGELETFGFRYAETDYAPGLIIPLRNVLGEQASFQYRPDVLHGETKYLNPAGQQHIVHVPLETRRMLDEDPTLPLLVVEGPIKADAAALRGIPCVSIQGVDCFSREKRLLPEFEALLTPGRPVVIVFDSDARYKVGVRAAGMRFRGLLRKEGADSSFLILPDGPEKVGLDDWLAANPEAGLPELMGMTSKALPGASTEASPTRADQFGACGILQMLEELADKKYPPWDVPGFIREGSLVNVYAPGGGTKTLLLTSLVASKAASAEWLGLRVRPGFGVYLAFEDYIGTALRIRTHLRYYKLEDRARGRIAVLDPQKDAALNLLDAESVGLLLGSFDLLPEKPRTVVVDSIGLAVGGADERDEATGRLLAAQCQRIQNYRWRVTSTDAAVRATDADPVTVILAHHENRQGGYGGTHRFRDFVDAMFQITGVAGGLFELGGDDPKANKMRHGPLPKPLRYGLLEVDPVNQIAVIVPADKAVLNLNAVTGNARKILDAMQRAAKPLRYAKLQQESGIPEGSFDKALKAAKDYCEKDDDGFYVASALGRSCYV
jgi:hypothetical protein